MLLAADRFEPSGPQHAVLIGILAVGALVLVRFGRAHRGSVAALRWGRVLAVLIACGGLPRQVYELTPGTFSFGSSLPLQLCDLAWVTAVWGLWTHHRVAVALTYYWGLTLTVQAILTPSLNQVFPDPRFLVFWWMHFLVVWSAVYLTFGLGLGPGWQEYGVAVAVSLTWALLAYGFDVALRTDYGYLAHKPASASLLDLLGPWPVYVVAALGILLAVWAAMTWPWVVARRRHATLSVA